jgi:hypothetical protein
MFGHFERRVPGISTAILRPHIDDARVRTLALDLEGSDECILGIDPHVTGLAGDFDTHRKPHH